jgi:hypothetical protein
MPMDLMSFLRVSKGIMNSIYRSCRILNNTESVEVTYRDTLMCIACLELSELNLHVILHYVSGLQPNFLHEIINTRYHLVYNN